MDGVGVSVSVLVGGGGSGSGGGSGHGGSVRGKTSSKLSSASDARDMVGTPTRRRNLREGRRGAEPSVCSGSMGELFVGGLIHTSRTYAPHGPVLTPVLHSLPLSSRRGPVFLGGGGARGVPGVRGGGLAEPVPMPSGAGDREYCISVVLRRLLRLLGMGARGGSERRTIGSADSSVGTRNSVARICAWSVNSSW